VELDGDLVELLVERVGGSARVVGDELAGRACGGVEGVVPGREEDVVAFEVQGAGEVDGVVAAQGVLGGEVAGLAGEWFVDRDDAELGLLLDRSASAVDGDGCAGDVARSRRREEGDDLGDLLGA
jgi:hypothetical protein